MAPKAAIATMIATTGSSPSALLAAAPNTVEKRTETERGLHLHRIRIQRSQHAQQLDDADVAHHAAVLQHRADAAGGDGFVRTGAEHGDAAAIRCQQAKDHADGGGLPCAVGAEQGGGLAATNRQREIAHRLHGAIRLGDAAQGDRFSRAAIRNPGGRRTSRQSRWGSESRHAPRLRVGRDWNRSRTS